MQAVRAPAAGAAEVDGAPAVVCAAGGAAEGLLVGLLSDPDLLPQPESASAKAANPATRAEVRAGRKMIIPSGVGGADCARKLWST
jgi:hypothetical protein